MDVQRVRDEVQSLRDEGFPVQYNEPAIVYVKVPFPEGWDVDADWILFKLGPNYPRTPPDPHIQEHRQYADGKVTHRIRLGGPWDQWCIHEFDWNPERHSLLTMVQLLVASLNRPTKPNPFKHYDPPDLGQLFDDS